jgi:hypothetical protein
MVGNNVLKDRLEVMPAYFWMYNLFALERNAWKAAGRDRRKIKIQRIETDYLAPDTAEEIIGAIGLLETWFSQAGLPEGEGEIPELPAAGLERNKRGAVILKPQKALAAYRRMLRFYAVKTLALFLDSRRDLGFEDLPALPGRAEERVRDWVNCGGQIVPAFRVDALRQEIREGRISTWEAIHAAYETWFAEYPLDKARHGWAVLGLLRRGDWPMDRAAFTEELQTALETRRWITEQVYLTRAKDFNDPFRLITYRNQEEMDRVAGRLEDNPFIKTAGEEGKRFEELIHNLTARL